MVVILLLTPYTTNGCDGGSNESSTVSTASTGDTVIPSKSLQRQHHAPSQYRQHLLHEQAPQLFPNSSHSHNSAHESARQGILPRTRSPIGGIATATGQPCWHCYVGAVASTPSGISTNQASTDGGAAISPTPPPLPKSKPPYEAYYGWAHANAIPKPPRAKRNAACPEHNVLESAKKPPPPPLPAWYRQSYEHMPAIDERYRTQGINANNYTNTNDFVRHVTRVNFYDIDTSQVEYEPKDDKDCDTEAITKEEEWITKRKTELTTTRQIETRVKRQVVLEDGKVVEDTGPIVSTNTTEDTDKQETETSEKRDLGVPVDAAINAGGAEHALVDTVDGQVAELGGNKLVRLVARPADGLVRETNDKRVISHEEVKDYLETEDVHHLGDISDEAYVQAVNSGLDNLEEALLSPDNQQQLVPLGPRVVANTTKSRKTIDSEDTQKRCLAQADGTIVTESKKTTEHEVIVEDELPDKDDNSTGSREKITTVETTQRHYKQRDEQNVDIVANGKVVGTEMRYAAETMQIEKDGTLERPGDWDSLSDRMRKLRRPHQKTLLQQQKEAALLADRKDALTKRPLDFDREEETRKGETMKWLESHFGSESTASNDSRDDDAEVEPTKKTYFNVTIKSNQATTNAHKAAAINTFDRKYMKEQETHANAAKSKYFQGISNWADRKEMPTNHFASKAFRDDLQETVERNRLKKGGVLSSRDKLNDGRHLVEPSDTYVSREDIIHQKRQSLSSQFLARTRVNSRDKLNELDTKPAAKEVGRNISGSHTDLRDLRYGVAQTEESQRTYIGKIRSPNGFNAIPARRTDYADGRAKSYERELNDAAPYDLSAMSSSTLGRPTVPQRRRAIEKKLRQQISISPPLKVPLNQHGDVVEPPPDYSPPPRSRSSSPHVDYPTRVRTKVAADASAYVPQAANISTLTRKQHQRTRFAPTIPSPSYQPTAQNQLRPVMATATQTTQTTPSTISTSTATSHKSSKVGQAIRNSLGKLVNKIRSASAERKLRMKSRSKSREQSPSSQAVDKYGNTIGSTTYQQYNIGGQPVSNESEHDSMHEPMNSGGKIQPHLYTNTATLDRGNHAFKHANSADPYENERVDMDQITSPRQRYYLGEDPYSSTLYGKENMYDPGSLSERHRNARDMVDSSYAQRNNRLASAQREGAEHYNQRNLPSSTLGRYQKSNKRLAGSTPNLSQDYRTVQTLPRKMHDKQQPTPQQSQYQKTPTRYNAAAHSTLGQPERRTQYQPIAQNAGPAKPARTYAKALNRSKSFNVYAINGSSDPSPVYIEKLTKSSYDNGNGHSNNNNNNSSNLHASQAYKSNPHLYSAPRESALLHSGLKSPSIVNLISRSQKDLSKIGTNEYERDTYVGRDLSGGGLDRHLKREEKKQVFLKGLHQQAPDLYKTLHGDEEENTMSKHQLQAKHSLDSRSPIEINKDTASIIRRGSSSNDEYVSAYNYATKSSELAQNKRILMYKDEQQRRRGSGSTIIEVRNIDSRK